MEQFWDFVDRFSRDHPLWYWLLVRFAVIVVVISMAVFAVTAVVSGFVAIYKAITLHFGTAVLYLLFLSVLCLAVWASWSILILIVEECF